ncbi:toxin-antitoxin system YwqK family antitoxin [Lacinutrix sp. Bg11-31]|uniref:toxin-antitoxin system YwqK family antitoxin n=1 Tax=Lacinutrix sp. Bg11-31 TaxID=2057808 RepID=UPI001E310E61|nr:toxin-antitoxin system YwqK family antitoxin [Lacinutrix sp. Bg11-31]
MIIKELQVTFSKLFLALSIVLFFSCKHKEKDNNAINNTENNSVLIEVLKPELISKPNIGLIYYNNEPFSGISVLNYPNGIKAEEIFYVEGKRQGSYKKWYQDETLSFESYYNNGLQHGTTKSWWKDGRIRSEANHLNGKVNGVQKQWYKEGMLFKEINIVNGKEEGLQRAWRRNGKLYNNYEAKNGRIFGLKRAGLCYELEEEVVQTKKL